MLEAVMDTEIVTREMHTGGGPIRIVESGFPELKAPTILGKRREVAENYDKVRRYLICEPRGHAEMYGAVLCESELEEADIGVIFMHNEGLGIMCGHAIIALARYTVDKGIVKRSRDAAETIVNIHCPCGLIKARVSQDNQVTFTSVPSFVFASDVELSLQNGNSVKIDVVFGGTFYALLDCSQLGIDIKTEPINKLTELGDEVKKLASSELELSHPDSVDLCFISGTVLHDGVPGLAVSRNLLIFADKQVERSACGSCVTARLVLQYHNKEINMHQKRTFHNGKVAHSELRGKVVEEHELRLPGNSKPTKAARVEVTGKAYYTGTNRFTAEPDDLLSTEGGFLLK